MEYNYYKEIMLVKEIFMNTNSKNLIRASMLLAFAVVFQILGRNIPQVNQLLVGPVVNSVLIIAACMCGLGLAIAVGSLTPIIALAVGQLPGAFAPFIPFIIIGNAIFIIVFYFIKSYGNMGKYAGIAFAALIKAGFLFLSASKLIHILNLSIPPKLAAKLVIMMGIPQLVTAIIGGLLGVIFIEVISKRKILINS